MGQSAEHRIKIVKIFFLLFWMILLTACAFTENYAPVTEISTLEPVPKNGKHRVAYQETIYSIAWIYGLDYRDIAKKNHLLPPYTVYEDQVIYLPSKKLTVEKTTVIAKPHEKSIVMTRAETSSNKIHFEPKTPVRQWIRPANGPIISKYGVQNKGINIAGTIGDPIFATAAGKVVYSGQGLRGYGNLIIIKHNTTYLSAYAHNNQVFVHNGDVVSAGQKIAEMGNSGTTRVMLHFEIRRNGEPVNPVIYLE
jgi:lipoprotein NlpD